MGDFEKTGSVLDGMFAKYPHFKKMLDEAPEVDPEEDRKAMMAEWEEERRAKRREHFAKLSRIPPAFERMTLEAFETFEPDAHVVWDQVTDWLDAWPDQTPRGLLFWGDPGTGKTHLSVAVMHELMGRGVPCMFSTAPELLDEMRREFSHSDTSAGLMLDLVKNVDVLLLDDLGTENLTEWAQERMFIIINHRYISDLPTIITTNLQPYDLQFKVGSRVFSRIIGMAAQLEVRGEDHRLGGK